MCEKSNKTKQRARQIEDNIFNDCRLKYVLFFIAYKNRIHTDTHVYMHISVSCSPPNNNAFECMLTVRPLNKFKSIHFFRFVIFQYMDNGYMHVCVCVSWPHMKNTNRISFNSNIYNIFLQTNLFFKCFT